MVILVLVVFVFMCGRIIYLGCVRRGWFIGSGFGLVMFNLVVVIVLLFNVLVKLLWFIMIIMIFFDVLIRIDVFFIFCNSLLFIIFLVSELIL